MDIIKKIKPLRASFENLSVKNKLILISILISLVTIIIPHETFAVAAQSSQAMIFPVGDYADYMAQVSIKQKKIAERQQTIQRLKQQITLSDRVRDYLLYQNSPLAYHANTLIQQKNWKKIIALSNAESSLCRRYPEGKANCWGVGGSELWTMGGDLDQAVIKMNSFLNNQPSRSPKKYAQMSFEEMNGLYKQPPADHWVYNNKIIYDELTELEQGL
ncbi:MAG: hypothetical protein ACM3NH_01270 [Candidatus Saccharibacteria bacterium]